jgi:hypothetical protein
LRGATPIGIGRTINRSLQPIGISIKKMHNGACRISVGTDGLDAMEFHVVSLRGKLIRRFAASSAGVRSVDFIWDGTDRFNRAVSSGVYLGIATSNGKIIGSKIVRR